MFAYIIKYQDVQRRMQEELDQVVGNDQLVCVSDKTNLPFVNAVIMVRFFIRPTDVHFKVSGESPVSRQLPRIHLINNSLGNSTNRQHLASKCASKKH
jgi:hypothetical protein